VTSGGKKRSFGWYLSLVRMAAGMGTVLCSGRLGDGRDDQLLAFVHAEARPGDGNSVIAAIDEFCAAGSMMYSIGPEKGAILDSVVKRVPPRIVPELGTYCGYSALRMGRLLAQGGRIISLEMNANNARLARQVWQHAGIDERIISYVVGKLSDSAIPDEITAAYGFAEGTLDMVFLDHDKRVYLGDLQTILSRNRLGPGSVAVADNVLVPGAPEYRA
jgi:catechol O-methyltransferase